jgi:transcriptional regulator
MYIPKHFAEPRVEVMHELMRLYPLAALVIATPTGLSANHIPLLLSAEPTPFGKLQGHVPRANPLWREYVSEFEALAVFQGPDAYITPNWYATKRETGKTVPTWNYAAVHAYGTLRVIDDSVWLRSLLEGLTTFHEAESHTPWSIADAPGEYIQQLITSLIGIEIVITKLEGKWKVSQNQPAHNQEGVSKGLRQRGQAQDKEMAKLVSGYME